MAFCYELSKDLCGCSIRNAVNIAFCHLFIHGLFVTAFVFSNTAYPPFYYVDYFYGFSGVALMFVSILGIIIAATLRKCQFIRVITAIIVVLNVFAIKAASIIYAMERWNDVITTAFTRAMRRPIERDIPDNLWYSLTAIPIILAFPFLAYLIYITSYLCNKWKSYLFTYNYEAAVPMNNPFYTGHFVQINMPPVSKSQAYEIQKKN